MSLAIMVGDSVTSLGLLSASAGRDYWHSWRCAGKLPVLTAAAELRWLSTRTYGAAQILC